MNPRTDLQFADDFIVDAIEAAQAREEAARVKNAELRAARATPPIMRRVDPRPIENRERQTRRVTRDPNALTPGEQVMFDLLKRQDWPSHTALGAAFSLARARPEYSLATINVLVIYVRRKARKLGWDVPYRDHHGAQARAARFPEFTGAETP